MQQSASGTPLGGVTTDASTVGAIPRVRATAQIVRCSRGQEVRHGAAADAVLESFERDGQRESDGHD
jgi:hypothetical protein